MKFKLNVSEFSFVFEDGDEYEIIRVHPNEDCWKIKRNSMVLSKDLVWHWEPQPSSRNF